MPAGIYTTNSPEACKYVADSCKANVIVVEDWKQLNKILQVYYTFGFHLILSLIGSVIFCPQIREQLPHLKAIVQYRGKPSQQYDGVYTVSAHIQSMSYNIRLLNEALLFVIIFAVETVLRIGE